jgi:drug/metabolite transporter (DMT)-like permease
VLPFQQHSVFAALDFHERSLTLLCLPSSCCGALQLVIMLTPMATALANKLLLKQPTPSKLWPTVVLTLAGSILMVVGNYVEAQHLTSIHGSTAKMNNQHDMVLGLCLAAVSMLLLTAYLVALQVTQHLVTGVQVMWGNTYVALVAFIPLACLIEGLDWSWVLVLRPLDWGVLVFAGFFIGACNTIFMQHCSRVLGAAVVSMFICLRLVSSLVGSIVLMQEVPTMHTYGGALVWVGFGMVLVTMTAYMVLQRFTKKEDAADEEVQREAALSAAEKSTAAHAAPAGREFGADEDDDASLFVENVLSSLHSGAASAVALQQLLLKQMQRRASVLALERPGNMVRQEPPLQQVVIGS